MTERTTAAQRKSERNPDGEKRSGRPKRVPVSGFRDLLTIDGKDPDFEYRWVSDKSDKGTRIQRFLRGGYVLVRSDEVDDPGEDRVYKTQDKGSLVAVPDGGSGNWLFAMKIQKEFYDEDQKAKEEVVDELEATTLAPPDPNDPEGRYGPGGKITYK